MYFKHFEKLAFPLLSRFSLSLTVLSFSVILLTSSLSFVYGQNHPNGMDFIGPDGLTYPDFTRAGIPGGIPNVQNIVATVERNSGNDRQAFINAVQTAANAGGGVVFVPNGTYNLSDHVMITSSNIVIRGESRQGVTINLNNNTANDGAAFFFKGNFGYQSTRITQDLRRGGLKVHVQDINMFNGTDFAFIRRERIPDYQQGKNGQNPNVYALQVVKILSRGPDYLEFDMPAREDYLTDQGSKVYRLDPIVGNGVENLSIYHPQEINSGKRSNGISFYFTFEFWAKNVAFYNITNHYIDYNLAKNGEIRDCYFEGSPRREEGGGNAYVGFWHAWDCLMENVRAKHTRHIAFQIFASGNVIRKSHFENAGDLNYHNLFPGHNLFEMNYLNDFNTTGDRTVVSWGVVTTPTTSGQHTPVGSGIVIYNNHFDTKEFGGGLFLGGLEKDMTYVYNLLEFKGDGWYDREYGNRSEPGIVFGNESRNTLIKGNVISLVPGGNSNTWAVAKMNTYNSSSYNEYKMVDNKFHGFRSDRQVKDYPSEFTNNQFLPETYTPVAPTPPVPSLYEWQLQEVGGGTTLPVEFADFRLIPNNLSMDLKWETQSEINTSHFVVERSVDGRMFIPLGNVSSSGIENSSANYSFNDAEISRNQTYYYRLRIVDLDGSFEFSRILEGKLENSFGIEMNLYPNPVESQLKLGVRLLEPMPYQVRVIDARGSEIFYQEYEGPEGSHLHELAFENLPSGIYHVTIVGNYEMLSASFVKQ